MWCCGKKKKKKRSKEEEPVAPASFFDQDGVVRFLKPNERFGFDPDSELREVVAGEQGVYPDPFEYDDDGYPVMASFEVPLEYDSEPKSDPEDQMRESSSVSSTLTDWADGIRDSERRQSLSTLGLSEEMPDPVDMEVVAADDIAMEESAGRLETGVPEEKSGGDPDPPPREVKSKEPGEAMKSRKQKLREMLESSKEKAKEIIGDSWFIVDSSWVHSWLAYAYAHKRVSPRPGPLLNMSLLYFDETKQFQPRKDLKVDASGKMGDYRAVKPAVYKVFLDCYPRSGPNIFVRGNFRQTENWFVDVSFFKRYKECILQCALAEKWHDVIKMAHSEDRISMQLKNIDEEEVPEEEHEEGEALVDETLEHGNLDGDTSL